MNCLDKKTLIRSVKRRLLTYFLPLALGGVAINVAVADNDDFRAWLEAENEQLNAFISREDQEFAEFLKKEWTAFQVFQGKIRPTKPKPAQPPRVTHAQASRMLDVVKAKGARFLDMNTPEGTFFGHNLARMEFPVRHMPSFSAPDNEAVSDGWVLLSRQNHDYIISNIEQYRDLLRIDDWGYLNLILHFLKPVFAHENQRLLYAWYLLNKNGYNVRLGYSKDRFTLLIPSNYTLYNIRYSEIDGKTYYMYPQLGETEVYSYEERVNDDLQSFSFDLAKLPALSPLLKKSQLVITMGDDKLTLPVQLDPGQIEYLRHYPNLELVWYFRAQMRSPAAEDFLATLKPYVQGKPRREAVEWLLQLTQSLFEYKTDQEQFGAEKYLLVDESFYYDYNDCEDRSIFFAWLLSGVLDIHPIVLDYPNHIALAVKLPLRPDDHYIEYEHSKYVIADPTYDGAGIGVAMPDLAQVQPKIIVP